MGGGLGHEGQLLARLLADADAGLAAQTHETFNPFVFALLRHHHLVNTTPASLDGFLYRMHPIQNFHSR
jgi:hypothetical protein